MGSSLSQIAEVFQGFWAHEAAYPLYLVAVGLAVFLFVRERNISSWRNWVSENRWMFLAVLAGSAWMQLGEPWGYRVYYDEPSHAAVARVMHLGRKFESIGSWHQPFEAATLYNTILPLRMGLFPFLLSVVHDLIGYRESNIFVLNALLGTLFLAVLFLLGRRLGGGRGAWFALFSFAGLPLLCQVVNSGSYDLLALLLLSCLFLQILRLEESPSPLRQRQLLAVGLLMMLARYEGAVYVLLAGVFILRAWQREGRISLSWEALLFPAAVLTVGIVRARYLEVNKDLVSYVKGSSDGMFSFSHIVDNLGDTLRYLFVPDRLGTGSAFLCWLGLFACLLMVFKLLGRGRSALLRQPHFRPTVLFTAFVVCLWAAVFLPTFWTNLTDPMASRFSLPLFLVACLAGCFVVGHLFPAGRTVSAAGSMVMATYLLGWSLPATWRHRATDSMGLVEVQKEWSAFAINNAGKSVLFSGESCLPLALRGQSATLAVVLNRAPEKVRRLVTLGIYEDVYFLETFTVGADAVTRNYRMGPKPDKRWERKSVLLREIGPGEWMEITRAVGYRPDDGSAAWKLERSPEAQPPFFDDAEKWRSYVRGFLLSEI